jgi:transglutaminase-like putative cysteine protease
MHRASPFTAERSEAAMSQANWSEYIQSHTVVTIPEKRPPVQFRWPAWTKDWESLLTFGLVLMVFLSVARSIQNADWVPGMPSLVGLAFVAMCAGLLLARVRVPEVVLHVLAFLIGAAIIFWLTLGFIDAPGGFEASVRAFGTRWKDWIGVVRRNEPTSDNMPFVMGVLTLTWICAYLAAWTIFRWRNAWLALIPGGIALLTNISYLPGQVSVDFVIFLFGAMLLVMRVHMLNKLHEWRRTNTPYPDFLSLNLLNITTWVAIGAIILAWSLPQANEIGIFSRAWEKLTSPLNSDSDHFVRLFSGIDAKREVPLHNFGDTLPLQGRVILGSKIAAQVEFGEGSNQGRALRVKVYDEYTPGGWKAGQRSDRDLAELEQIQPSSGQKLAYKDRQEVAANFVRESGFPKNSLPTIGQPATVTVASRAEVISTDTVPDIDALRSRQPFKVGDPFVTTGTISTASAEKLRASGEAYPQYVRDRYLQLPAGLPQRVRQLSADLTKDRPTAYDKAKAIEEYLRTFPPTFEIRTVPPGRDAVDFFLFDEKKGYFDYQASAMVVLLRGSGVPARLAVGYVVDEFDPGVRRYLLRDKHAYAWPEVYFPGYGWVEFSPYGDAPVITRPESDGSIGDTTINESGLLGEGPGLDFGDIEQGQGSGALPVSESGIDVWKFILPVLYVLLVIVVIGGTAGIGLKLAWERGMSGLDYPAQLWEKTVRLASWLRLGPKPYQTATEYGRSLRSALPDVTDGLDVVVDSYQVSRYGRRDLTPVERDRLDTVWPPLRNGLIRRVLRWKSR